MPPDPDPMANTCRRLEIALTQTEQILAQVTAERDGLASELAAARVVDSPKPVKKN